MKKAPSQEVFLPSCFNSLDKRYTGFLSSRNSLSRLSEEGYKCSTAQFTRRQPFGMAKPFASSAASSSSTIGITASMNAAGISCCGPGSWCSTRFLDLQVPANNQERFDPGEHTVRLALNFIMEDDAVFIRIEVLS